jgi:hypothetical protein
MKTCYACTPMGTKVDRDGLEIDFDKMYREAIKPALENAGVQCRRADELKMTGIIQKATLTAIINSDIMIADLTTHNPNVLYEIGVRHAVRPGMTIMLYRWKAQPIPFDLAYTLAYSYELNAQGELGEVEAERLKDHIRKAVQEAGEDDNNSPLYDFFPELDVKLPKKPCIFIGHGHSEIYKRIETYISEELKLEVVTYETESVPGDSVGSVLERMLRKATFAVLVLTAEDNLDGVAKRARQNVIHEAGLFQGVLGFSKAIVVRQEGVEEFSNVAGLRVLNFEGDDIQQTFPDIKKALERAGLLF